MNAEDEKHLRRILAEAGVSDTDYTNANWWIQEEVKHGTPVLSKALFLREVWRAVIPHDSPDWDERLLSDLKQRKGDGDVYYTSRVTRQNPALLDVIKSFAASPRGREALTLLVRAAQINVLASVVQLLDGGYTFEEGLSARWTLCGTDSSGDPTQSVGSMGEVMWAFDPASRS
jgi:hypothetical protein